MMLVSPCLATAPRNIGAFHEALNLAAIWRLPALFVIENNVYGEYSRINLTTPIEDLAERGPSYAMPARVADGQDVDEVVAVIGEEVSAIRADGCPRLVECKTYRYAGHSRSDQAAYRPEGELDSWRARDPIERFQERLIAEGVLTSGAAFRMREQVAARIEQAVAVVQDSPEPGPEAMFAHIYPDETTRRR